MTGQWFENRFARGIDLNPSLAIDDRCHASQHASASVGRSPPREHCVSRLPELISSFYCRQTNAVSISRKRDPILLGPRRGERRRRRRRRRSRREKSNRIKRALCGKQSRSRIGFAESGRFKPRRGEILQLI